MTFSSPPPKVSAHSSFIDLGEQLAFFQVNTKLAPKDASRYYSYFYQVVLHVPNIPAYRCVSRFVIGNGFFSPGWLFYFFSLKPQPILSTAPKKSCLVLLSFLTLLRCNAASYKQLQYRHLKKPRRLFFGVEIRYPASPLFLLSKVNFRNSLRSLISGRSNIYLSVQIVLLSFNPCPNTSARLVEPIQLTFVLATKTIHSVNNGFKVFSLSSLESLEVIFLWALPMHRSSSIK